MNTPKPPKELDAIADVVLAYRPKPKTEAAKKRKKLAKKFATIIPSGASKLDPQRK